MFNILRSLAYNNAKFYTKTFTRLRMEASSGSMISFMDPDPTGFRYTTQFFAHSAACKISVAAGPHSHRPPIQEAVADEVHKLLKLLSKNTVSEFAHAFCLCLFYLYLSRKRRAWYHRSSVILGRSENIRVQVKTKVNYVYITA